jgi:BMFP domain-containing protein YqiC
MTQTTNRFLDEFAKLMTDAAGAADGLRKEVESVFKAQGERFLREMDVVRREEFEAVKAMAEKARAENERLEARITVLEGRLAATRSSD